MEINTTGLTEDQIGRLVSYADSLRATKALGGIKCTVTSGNTYHIDIQELSEFKDVVDRLPIMGEVTATIENPAVVNLVSRFILIIKYDSSDGRRVWLNTPMTNDFTNELIDKGIISRTRRKVYDSEYHYFTGISERKLRGIELLAYKFNVDNIAYYGGSMKTQDQETISEILNILSTK